MKKAIKIILTICLFWNSALFAQDYIQTKILELKEKYTIPELTHEQMYQDLTIVLYLTFSKN